MGLAVVLSASAAEKPGRPEQQRKLVVPSDQALTIMIKTTLIAFNDANRTGNYSVLRDLASPSFREANTSAQLAEIFQGARHSNLDLAPIVLFQPQLVRKPAVDQHGLLQVSGFFATRPEQVQFDLAFQEVDGYWRLFGIHVTAQKVVEVPTARNDQPTGQGGPADAGGTPAGSKTVVATGRSVDTGIPTGPASLMEPPLPTLKPKSKQ